VYQKFGDVAPRRLDGESAGAYTRRLLEPLKKHHPDWANDPLPTELPVLNKVKEQILKAAGREAVLPTNIPPGTLIERVTKDAAGREISRFYGDPEACWGEFKIPPKFVIGWNRK
jgi:hypothetical protein